MYVWFDLVEISTWAIVINLILILRVHTLFNQWNPTDCKRVVNFKADFTDHLMVRYYSKFDRDQNF